MHLVTGMRASAAQEALAERWEAARATVPTGQAPVAPIIEAEGSATVDVTPAGGAIDHGQAATLPPLEPGDPYAVLWFERDGAQVLTEDKLYVVEGVDDRQLRGGPGHYPTSARHGADGNVGIAGHRSTYGAPFWSLGELRDGDTIHVVDTAGVEWVYAYHSQVIVDPSEAWVVGEDPIGTGEPTVTLTTCHPRFSDRQRLVVFGELVETIV